MWGVQHDNKLKKHQARGYLVKITLNKNETGCFRIQFHVRENMHKILTILGYVDEESLIQ